MRQARGVPIDANDRDGRPIHIGDTLEFDPGEWGCICVFVVELRGGQIVHPGATGDLGDWCRVIIAWDSAPLPTYPVKLTPRPCKRCGGAWVAGEDIEYAEDGRWQHKVCPERPVDADGYTACPSCGAVLQAGKDCLCGWAP